MFCYSRLKKGRGGEDNERPLSFDKHLVVLQWYDKEVPLRALEFNKIPIWVQIHDVPIRFMNKTVAEKLCEVVGEVCKNTRRERRMEGVF